MCSPPYWSQRDYKVEGQIGLEKTYQEWLEKMWLIMDEIRRVLRKDGTCWVNLGDKYGTGSGSGSREGYKQATVKGSWEWYEETGRPSVKGSEKSLLFIPERFAIGCLERGWTIPNKNIWHKPNPMPSSGKGRFTNTWEYLYFMVKNTKPIMWIHRYTAEMVSKKPKDRTKIICPECEGKGTKNVMLWEDSMFPETAQVECSECRGKGEVSIWRSEDYWFDLDSVRRPHKEIQWRPNLVKTLKSKELQGNPISLDQKLNQEKYHPAGKNPGDVIHGEERTITTKIQQEDAEKMGSPRARQWRKRGACYEENKHLNIRHGQGASTLSETHPAGANPGDFWSIPTQPSKLPHYASYPEKLCLTPLKAGCPRWICKECGMARVRVTRTDYISTQKQPDKDLQAKQPTHPRTLKDVELGRQISDYRPQAMKHGRANAEHHTLGWSFCSCLCPACGEADCKCGEKWRPGIVLDPFVGIGTTCIVAKKLGLSYLGIDLKRGYCDMAEKRLKDVRYQGVFDL